MGQQFLLRNISIFFKKEISHKGSPNLFQIFLVSNQSALVPKLAEVVINIEDNYECRLLNKKNEALQKAARFSFSLHFWIRNYTNFLKLNVNQHRNYELLSHN